MIYSKQRKDEPDPLCLDLEQEVNIRHAFTFGDIIPDVILLDLFPCVYVMGVISLTVNVCHRRLRIHPVNFASIYGIQQVF
jgi:hypothetical protein